MGAHDVTPQPDGTGACPDFGDWLLDTPEPETEPCTITGDDDACDTAYQVRFRHARHGWPYPVITITAYAARYIDDQDGWEGYVARVQTEWLVCDDPGRHAATARYGTGERTDDPEFYDHPADADETARAIAAGAAGGTEEWILGCALDWNGRDGLP